MNSRCALIAIFALLASLSPWATASQLDKVLNGENKRQGVSVDPAPVVDDLTFLRRVSIDLIGRIPTLAEIEQFKSWPAAERRRMVVDQLLEHERYADRWTAFYADMLRLRSNAEGGVALFAYVHRALEEDMPYDELVRRLISTNGKANQTPEAGFVLGDNADPMALASATAQVFMGVRMGCAQCHDHPFDVWTQEDFYGLAAFYGKTRRVDSRLTRVVYTTESNQSTVLWPPEGMEGDDVRKPMTPKFPFFLAKGDRPSHYIARLQELRSRPKPEDKKPADADVLALLDATAKQANKRVDAADIDALGVDDEAQADIRKIDIKGSLYRHSEMRVQLGKFITDPRNRFFSRSLVNRVWAQLVGRGFVEPVDDFRDDNPPSHNDTLDYLADEFVASGFSHRALVRMIVLSDAYGRDHVSGADPQLQTDMEAAFLATPMRRVLSESLYDSVVTAGHLFDVKHLPGQNEKVVYDTIRVLKESAKTEDGKAPVKAVAALTGGNGGEAMAGRMAMASMPMSAYRLEDAIELDFDKVLKASSEEVTIDKMQVMSAEELEAMRMMRQNRPRGDYITKQVKRVYDDNPKFNSSLRMASPAPAGHFLRVFGQPDRSELGQNRDETPTMRQALMMLNGRMTNEASRVGPLEPIYPLLVGSKADLNKAIRLAYVEILTRSPSDDEVSEAKEIIGAADDVLAGMADLRWVLLNCNEFRYLP